MTRTTSFIVTYDSIEDVLYVSKKKGHAVHGLEDEYGFVWRYDGKNDLIGVTVMDFRSYWQARKEILAREMSVHFDLTPTSATDVLDDALRG